MVYYPITKILEQLGKDCLKGIDLENLDVIRANLGLTGETVRKLRPNTKILHYHCGEDGNLVRFLQDQGKHRAEGIALEIRENNNYPHLTKLKGLSRNIYQKATFSRIYMHAYLALAGTEYEDRMNDPWQESTHIAYEEFEICLWMAFQWLRRGGELVVYPNPKRAVRALTYSMRQRAITVREEPTNLFQDDPIKRRKFEQAMTEERKGEYTERAVFARALAEEQPSKTPIYALRTA